MLGEGGAKLGEGCGEGEPGCGDGGCCFWGEGCRPTGVAAWAAAAAAGTFSGGTKEKELVLKLPPDVAFCSYSWTYMEHFRCDIMLNTA